MVWVHESHGGESDARSRKPHLWYINGRVYNLSTFQHPGGPIALSLAQGRDATQLFYSYHPFASDKVETILRKYRVSDTDTEEWFSNRSKPDESGEFVAQTQQEIEAAEDAELRKRNPSLDRSASKSSPQDDDADRVQGNAPLFDFSSAYCKSPFWTELSNEVQIELQKIGTTKANGMRWLQLALMSAVVLLFLPFFLTGYWWAVLLFPLAYWVLGVNTFHDASHFALSTDWRINHYICYLFPIFSSPFTWYHQHVIGHHVYTNMAVQDPDMRHGTNVFRYSLSRKHQNVFEWQMHYLLLIWMNTSFLLAFTQDFLFFWSGHYEYIRMVDCPWWRKMIHLAGRLITFSFIFVWPFFLPNFSWFKAIIWSFFPYSMFSLAFSIASQLNHITDENMDRKEREFDWHVHQVTTSHTFAPDSLFWFIVTGGLNLQIEHHLFPSVNHWHLRKIQPIVERCCLKYGVPYHCSKTFSIALGKHLSHMTRMSVPHSSESPKTSE